MWKRLGMCLGIAGAWGIVAAAESNLVQNAGFEQTEKNGATVAWQDHRPGYHFADGAGREGSRGLVFENSDPHFYSFPAQKLNLQPGGCYAYEVWVKTEGLTGDESGATACMEWYGADGKHLGGSYADGVRGSSEGWQRVHGVTRAIPTNAVRVSVAPYVRRGMTGKAWFDDLKVTRYYPPLVSAVSASCYRNVSAGGPVVLTAGLTLDASGVTPEKVKGVFVIASRDGQPVRRLKPESLTPDRAALTLDASTLPVGTYDVRFTVATLDGVQKSHADMIFQRVGKLPARRVYVDAHRRLMVDGQPFFPLGMYWHSVKHPKLETYAKGPFNCLMPYGSPTLDQMDACQACGLKVIYSIKDFYAGTRWAPAGMKTDADETAAIKRRVEAYHHHPALMAWYINDELPVSMVRRLAARQRLMEELDPDHPTWVVLYQREQIDAYMQTFDVIGTDPYPIPDKPVGTALDWTRSTRDRSYGTRAIWQVPQVFDWGAYRKGDAREKTRAPTLAEMRAMAWQCIAGGANGLVFYSFFDLFKMSARDPFEQRWSDVCTMASEIRRYIPVLLSADPPPPVSCQGPASVQIRVWRSGGDIYVLAVNGASTTATATLTLDADIKTLKAEFGVLPQRKGPRQLVCTLSPLDPVFVRLSAQ